MKKNHSKPAHSLQSIIFVLVVFVCFLFSTGTYANNIVVSGTTVYGHNSTFHTTLVQFDLTWENSFRVDRGPTNWDAAWVFVKYRVPINYGGDGVWRRASMSSTVNATPAGSAVDVGLLTPGTAYNATSNPVMGVFVHRSVNGVGTFTANDVELTWNYGTDIKTGATLVGDNDVIDIQVYAIEMVYVPAGNFYLGSGGTENGAFYQAPTTSNPYLVSSESQITVNASSPNLYYPLTGTNVGDQSGPIVAAFPKGYNGFYCMKYEISQQGYVDFLNSLTRVQQANRVATSVGAGTTAVTNRYVMINSASLGFRNGIRCDATINTSDPITFYCDLSGNGTGGEAADGKELACNYLSWADLSAYLDWSGLRPMSELEYEKACRGTKTPVANEFSWGSINITQNTGISSSGLTNETSSNLGNCTYASHASVQGPMRVGALAQNPSSRERSGATFYGIMDMSGNMWERVVTVGNSTGRTFTGIHGNGALDVNGLADPLYWPSSTTALGVGLRGGSWTSSASWLPVSDASFKIYTVITRTNEMGGRGVRLVP